MSLLDALRSGVKVAHNVTKPLQVVVSFERFSGEDGYGTKQYLSKVSLTVIEDWKQTQVRTLDGQLATSRANVLFLDVAALRAATPATSFSTAGVIGVNDRIGLSDGTFPPILSLGGFIDAGTKAPVATQAWF